MTALADKRTVLVVDDDPDVREAMRTLLTDLDFDVVMASDGKGAIHYLTASLPEPALIVADLAMPDMSGWELLEILQAYMRLSSIPVLVVTGADLGLRPVRDEAVLEVFSKPLDTTAFISAVQRHALSTAARDARKAAAAGKLSRPPF